MPTFRGKDIGSIHTRFKSANNLPPINSFVSPLMKMVKDIRPSFQGEEFPDPVFSLSEQLGALLPLWNVCKSRNSKGCKPTF